METRDIRLPLDPSDPGGPFWSGECFVRCQKGDNGIAELGEVDQKAVKWIEEFASVCFRSEHNGETLTAIREATDEDYKAYRTPRWIQGDEVPECCGNPMSFIGQLDDGTVWAEPPPGFKMWWHDTASFYVFTCPQCLTVEAVGQQY